MLPFVGCSCTHWKVISSGCMLAHDQELSLLQLKRTSAGDHAGLKHSSKTHGACSMQALASTHVQSATISKETGSSVVIMLAKAF